MLISLVLLSDSSEVYRFPKHFFISSSCIYGFGIDYDQRNVIAFSLRLMYIIKTNSETGIKSLVLF